MIDAKKSNATANGPITARSMWMMRTISTILVIVHNIIRNQERKKISNHYSFVKMKFDCGVLFLGKSFPNNKLWVNKQTWT